MYNATMVLDNTLVDKFLVDFQFDFVVMEAVEETQQVQEELDDGEHHHNTTEEPQRIDPSSRAISECGDVGVVHSVQVTEHGVQFEPIVEASAIVIFADQSWCVPGLHDGVQQSRGLRISVILHIVGVGVVYISVGAEVQERVAMERIEYVDQSDNLHNDAQNVEPEDAGGCG